MPRMALPILRLRIDNFVIGWNLEKRRVGFHA